MKAASHIKFARALRQLEQAANNLREVAAECGDDTSRHAGLLALHLRNALVYGPTYIMVGRAQEFDYSNKQKEAV